MKLHRKTSENGIDRFRGECSECIYKTRWSFSAGQTEGSLNQHIKMKHPKLRALITRMWTD